MLTIKLPIQVTEEEKLLIKDYQRQQSSVIRFAFNRFTEGKDQKEIRSLVKDLNNIDLLDSWIIQSGIMDAKMIFDTGKEKPLFGGKKNWKEYVEGKKTKEEFKDRRMFPLDIQGEASQKGNRKFELHIDENYILFKPERNSKIKLLLPKLRNGYSNKLSKLQELTRNKELPFSVKLTSSEIFITFDETKLYKKEVLQTIENRVLGIDLNPNYIGLSVIDVQDKDTYTVIHKEVIDFSNLKENNKRKFETIEVSKRILNLSKEYQCSKVVIEDLSIKVKEHKKGKNFNKLVNNDWQRQIIVQQLQKRFSLTNIEFVLVNAAYSSTVGNVLNGNDKTPDMVASSIEIARRGFNKFGKEWFYPTFTPSQLNNQWKEEAVDCKSWVALHKKIKNFKLRYRVQLKETIPDTVFRNKSLKSKTDIFLYNC